MTIQPAQVDNLLPSYLLAGGLPSGSASFDDLILAIEDASPLIEPGDYDAVALTCKKAKRFNRMLLAFRFQIASQGSSLGLIVPGYVNLPGGNRFRTAVPALSKLGLWLQRIHTFDPQVSPKRVHLKTFAQYWFRVRVRTCSGHKEHPLPPSHHYSQVEDILEVIGRRPEGGKP